MISFSDGIAGHTHDSPIRYLLAFWFYIFCTLMISRRMINNGPVFETALLLIGSIIGSVREGFMFILDYGYHRNLISPTVTLDNVPLLDHTFQMLSLLSFYYAILYLARPPKQYIKYYHFSYVIPFIIYCGVTFFNFNALKNNSYYHAVNLSHLLMMFMSISVFIFVYKAKKYLPVAIMGFLVFTFASQVYGALNLLTDLKYNDIFMPYHNAYYLWSIPFIMYYIQSIPIRRVKTSLLNNDH